MKLPTKFKLNTEDFKIYFDNKKKTHVCENLETGEKTNIGVLGIFMQMGILESIQQDKKADERISVLSEKMSDLENKVDDILKNMNTTLVKPTEIKGDTAPEEVKEEKVEEKSKPDIKEHIMKKVLEQTVSEEKEETKPEKPSGVSIESEEEINNWMDI